MKPTNLVWVYLLLVVIIWNQMILRYSHHRIESHLGTFPSQVLEPE